MKKLFSMVLVWFLLISLSGCTGTRMTVCNYSSSEFSTKVTISSKNKKMTYVVATETSGGFYAWEAESVRKTKEEETAYLNEIKGFSAVYSIDKIKNELVLNVNIDFEKT